jgi:hypothetical protein
LHTSQAAILKTKNPFAANLSPEGFFVSPMRQTTQGCPEVEE